MMIATLRRHYEKPVLGAGLGLLAAGVAWAWSGHARVTTLRRPPVAARLEGATYQSSNSPQPGGPPPVWSEPPAQAPGTGWIYEVFTPPTIFYNAAARSFDVTPPLPGAESELSVGPELLEVKRAPYRLQLVGYFGAPGNYTAAFISPLTAEALLAREGGRFAQLGLALKSFSIGKVPVENSAGGTRFEVAAVAVLEDEWSGEVVTLDSRARKLTDTPLAVLRLKGRPAVSREFREGDTVQDDETLYRVERIQLAPPEVVVSKSAPGVPHPENRVLHPAKAMQVGDWARPKDPSGQGSPGRSGTGLANADRHD